MFNVVLKQHNSNTINIVIKTSKNETNTIEY